MKPSSLLQATCIMQGAYFILTGLWPLVSIKTFEKVTGPKADKWLVKTVGVIVLVEGVVFIQAWNAHRITPEISLLGVGSALGLMGIDLVCVAKKRIPPVYLGDAVVELLLVVGWLAGGRMTG